MEDGGASGGGGYSSWRAAPSKLPGANCAGKRTKSTCHVCLYGERGTVPGHDCGQSWHDGVAAAATAVSKCQRGSMVHAETSSYRTVGHLQGGAGPPILNTPVLFEGEHIYI